MAVNPARVLSSIPTDFASRDCAMESIRKWLAFSKPSFAFLVCWSARSLASFSFFCDSWAIFSWSTAICKFRAASSNAVFSAMFLFSNRSFCFWIACCAIINLSVCASAIFVCRCASIRFSFALFASFLASAVCWSAAMRWVNAKKKTATAMRRKIANITFVTLARRNNLRCSISWFLSSASYVMRLVSRNTMARSKAIS